MTPLSTTTVSKSIDSITDIVDAVPFDSIADTIADTVSDAADTVTDVAVVAGARGGRLVMRTARVAWRNRRTVTISLVLLAAIAAIVAWQRKSTDDLATN